MLIRLAEALLYFCKRNNTWDVTNELLSDSRPLRNFIDHLSSDHDVKKFFDYETAFDVIAHILSDSTLHSQSFFSDPDYQSFVDRIKVGIKSSAADHWIVIPIKFAQITETVRFKNYLFISGDRKNKIDTLRMISKISIKEANSRAEHTEVSRSPGFFEHPLLAIKVFHQTGFIHSISPIYEFAAITALQVVYWSSVYQTGNRSIVNLASALLNSCNHLAIYTKDDWRFRHRPLSFNSLCRFDLDWIAKKSNQTKFDGLIDLIVNRRQEDDLAYRFFKAARFFSKAIEVEETKDLFEGMGISVLYLMIAAEAALLDRDSEKRSRLAVLLPRLIKLSANDLRECVLAIEKAYAWRSDFVHSGHDTYRDWDDNFQEGEKQATVKLIKQMIARLIAASPQHFQEMRSQASQAGKKTPSDLWFRFLRNIWTETLTT